jgi:hypothetical protein
VRRELHSSGTEFALSGGTASRRLRITMGCKRFPLRSTAFSDVSTSGPQTGRLWQRIHIWFVPRYHALLHHNVSSGKVGIVCKLSRARLAYLWQHVVKGSAILPGAAMYELGLAAMATLDGKFPNTCVSTHRQDPRMPYRRATAPLTCRFAAWYEHGYHRW